MKKILMLGGSAQQIIAIETAKRLGLYTVLCDYLPDNPGQYHSDKFYLASTTDMDLMLNIAIDEAVDYVLAYASDPAAPTAAYIAEKLNLPTNPYKSVEILCNKDLFRSFLRNNGYNTPRSFATSGYDEGSFQFDLSYPIIVKPVDSSGSKGATVLKNGDSIKDAIDFALSFSRGHKVIVEEYIEKKHPYLIGGDIFVSDGEIVLWGLMNCHRDNNVNPLVPVGKSYPPALEKEDLQLVKNTLQKLVSDLGIRFGPMNVELIVDANNRVFPIDIGPRSGGNMIPDLLGMIFETDLVELSVRCAMGEQIGEIVSEGRPYFSTLNLHSDRKGTFVRIDIDPEIDSFIVRKVIYKQNGDEVERFVNASHSIGVFFFHFPDRTAMIHYMNNMNRYIKIVLKGDV